MGLGRGCALVEGEPVVGMSKGGVVEPRDGLVSSIGGPSVELLLGITDIESVVLCCLSIAVSERVSPRGLGDTCRSVCDIAGGDAISTVEGSVIVRLRAGVDTPEGVAVGGPVTWRRSRGPLSLTHLTRKILA
jgi:hypothetical protein